MVYCLNLTKNDLDEIFFIGFPYNWKSALSSLNEGNNFLTEREAKRITKSFEEDIRKENRPLPLLSRESKLYVKLMDFWKSVI